MTDQSTIRGEALRAYRGYHLRRRQIRAAAVACLAMSLCVLGYLSFGTSTTNPGPMAKTTDTESPARLQRISDAEVLAAFPDAQAYWVMVDGRPQLFFEDPEARKRYVRDLSQPTDPPS